MKSDGREISGGKIEKATELLWKIWWFSFYMLIVPSLIAVIGFFIFYFMLHDVFISSGFTVLTFMFSLLVFYKPFDKYRNDPFFLKSTNNPSARIHILYLISIVALIVTPIFVYITPENYHFELLPLISYCILYNVVYLYFIFQPIDYFDFSEGKFKHSGPFSDSVKKFYNYIIVINFISHVVFLSYTFDTKYSWLFALISDLIFYLISILSTRSLCKKITIKIQQKEPIISELNEYKHKFSILVISLIFLLLIQMPFVVIIIFSLLGQVFSYIEIFNASLFSIALFLFYLKTRVYFSIYHYRSIKRSEFDAKE